MNKGGRRKNPIRESFYKLSVDGKTFAKFKNFGNIQSNKDQNDGLFFQQRKKYKK